MKLKLANLWDSEDPIIAVTTNSAVKNGALIMGAGSAKQARQRYPDLPVVAGHQIKEMDAVLGEYGFLVVKVKNKQDQSKLVGLFQSKKHFSNNSEIGLIKRSCDALLAYIDLNPGIKYQCPSPALGSGS